MDLLRQISEAQEAYHALAVSRLAVDVAGVPIMAGPAEPAEPRDTAQGASARRASPDWPLPALCGVCGCQFCWEDLAGELHCCECFPIPVRRLAVELWRPGGDNPERPRWVVWEPAGYWEPFGHLAAAEQEQRAAVGAAAVEGGF